MVLRTRTRRFVSKFFSVVTIASILIGSMPYTLLFPDRASAQVGEETGEVATDETVTPPADELVVDPVAEEPAVDPVVEEPAVTSTEAPVVTTDKQDYSPEETVIVTGMGFPTETGLVVKITRPDGSVVVGDGSFALGSDSVTTDVAGGFTYSYILDGIEGEYGVGIMQGDVVLASTTFTDTPPVALDAVPVVSIDEAAAKIVDSYACGVGSVWSDDGLHVTVQNWVSGYQLQGRYYIGGDVGNYGAWMNFVDGLWGSGDLTEATGEFTLMNTGNSPEGLAGWEVQVLDAQGNPMGAPDRMDYTIINDLDATACGGTMALGYETTMPGDAGLGQCNVTTDDQSRNGGLSSLQILEWEKIDLAAKYRLSGYVWSGTAWTQQYTNYVLPDNLVPTAELFWQNPASDNAELVKYVTYATPEGTYTYVVEALDAAGHVLSTTTALSSSDDDMCKFTVDRTGSTIPAVCGDGAVQGSEQCDDGNTNNNDYCTNSCQFNAVCVRDMNMVVDGSFETPIVTTTEKWDIFDDGTAGLGWHVDWRSALPTVGGLEYPRPAHVELQAGVNGWVASEGFQYAELDSDWDGPAGTLNGEPASVAIYQNLATVPGNQYEVTFDFSPRPGTGADENVLEFRWGGVLKDTLSGAGGANTVWTPKTYTFTATSSVIEIRFTDLGTANSLGTFIDNVQVRCLGPATSTVTVCKTNPAGAPLSGWRVMLLGGAVESLTVPSDGSPISGTYPTDSYALRASGTYNYGNASMNADAANSYRHVGLPCSGSTDAWVNGDAVSCMNHFLNLNPSISGGPTDAGLGSYYNPENIYAKAFSGGALDLKIWDSCGTTSEGCYGDNEGSLTVDLYKGYVGDTDASGCVTFTDVPLGTYTLEEILQDGWAYQSGDAGTVTVDEATEEFKLVNARATGSLEVTKIVDWKSITPDTSKTFEICVEGPSITPANCQSADFDGGVVTWGALLPGDYSVTETDPGAEWLVTGSGDVVAVPFGDPTTHTVTNTIQYGSITIVKDAVPNDNRDFSFTGGLGAFTLDDDANDRYQNTRTFDNLIPGPYAVTEGTVSGWALTDIQCTGGQTTPTRDGQTITIALGADEDIICTFTNKKLGSVSGVKYNDKNGNNEWNLLLGEGTMNGWRIFIDGDGNGVYDAGEKYNDTHRVIALDGVYVLDGLLPGTYSLCEVMKPGWYSSLPGQATCRTITIDPGENEMWVNFGNHQAMTVRAYKIVCDQESDLPNWGSGGPNISATTAQNYVRTHPSCHLESGWDFQYGIDGQVDKYGNGDQTGLAGAPWKMLGTTDASGSAAVQITDLEGASGLWVRENLKPDYLPFTYPPKGPTEDNVSAEIYCHRDVEHYDNYDKVSDARFGETYYCVAFNTLERGSIVAHKFEDNNGNSQQDSDDANLAGWEMRVYKGTDCQNQVILNGSQDTGSDGNATFANLVVGAYSVQEILTDQPNWVNITDTCQNITVNPNQTTTVEFGNFKFGSIQGRKFNDLNMNGGRDAGEPWLADWTINLYKKEGSAWTYRATTMTDASGLYTFEGLDRGRFFTCEVLPADWKQTNPGDSEGHENMSGNTNEASRCRTVNVDRSSVAVTGRNFGNVKLGSISGTKYEDINRSGTRDTIGNTLNTEPGLPGWTINLYDASDVFLKSVQTDGKGDYWFEKLLPGTYKVCEVSQTGWVQTSTPECYVTVVNGDDHTFSDFGNFELGMIQGRKYNDVWGDGMYQSYLTDDRDVFMNDWTIRLYEELTCNTTLADDDADDDDDACEDAWVQVGYDHVTGETGKKGQYRFEGLDQGTYYVCEGMQDGWTQTGPLGQYISFSTDAIDPAEAGEADITEMVERYNPNRTPVTNESPNAASEGGMCWQVTVNRSGQFRKGLMFGNYADSTINAFKYEDSNHNGQQDDGEAMLPGWEMILSKMPMRFVDVDAAELGSTPVATPSISTPIPVPADGTVVSLGIVPVGSYLHVMVNGTAYAGDDIDFDAECSSTDGGSWNTFVQNYESYGESLLDLQINGASTDWGLCSTSHTYSKVIAGTGAEVTLRINDIYYDNNTDGLTVYTTLIDPDEVGTTDENGKVVFDELGPDGYMVCEVQKDGWAQTEPSTELEPNSVAALAVAQTAAEPIARAMGSCYMIPPHSGGEQDVYFGNWQRPGLLITKANDQPGDLNPGDEVRYTITVEAVGGEVFDVIVKDVPPAGVVYRTGTGTIDGLSSAPSLQYSLSGVSIVYENGVGTWYVGNLAAGQTATLTYMADISETQEAGKYPDLAWADGLSEPACNDELESQLSRACIASTMVRDVVAVDALAPAYPDDPFVGTEVRVVVPLLAETGVVLGARTELQRTGQNILVFLIAAPALLGGALLMLLGKKRKEELSKTSKIAAGVLGGMVAVLMFGVLSASPSLAADNLALDIETPKSPTNEGSFVVSYVAIDRGNRSIAIDCQIDIPGGDIEYTSFDSKTLDAPGGSGDCQVTSDDISLEGEYLFKVVARVEKTGDLPGDLPTEIREGYVKIVYDKTAPGAVTNYVKTGLGTCQYKLTFKTADDGQTAKVEVYRSQSTSFKADASTHAGDVTIGPNTAGEFSETVSGCTGTVYYALRAVDASGNGSGFITDEVVNVTYVILPGEAGGAGGAGGGAAAEGEVAGEETGPEGAEGDDDDNAEGEVEGATDEETGDDEGTTGDDEGEEVDGEGTDWGRVVMIAGIVVAVGALGAVGVYYLGGRGKRTI